MTDNKIEFDSMTLDPDFVRACSRQAEKLLWGYANDPTANPLTAQMLTMFLNTHMSTMGMLKAVVDIHNNICKLRDQNADPSAPIDVGPALRDLALLAASCATGFGDQMGHIVVRFRHEPDGSGGGIEFDNLTGKGCSNPDEPEVAQGVH